MHRVLLDDGRRRRKRVVVKRMRMRGDEMVVVAVERNSWLLPWEHCWHWVFAPWMV